jgi:hypothetical protein
MHTMPCHQPMRVSSTSVPPSYHVHQFKITRIINALLIAEDITRIMVIGIHFYSFPITTSCQKGTNHCNSTQKKSIRLLISHSKFTRVSVESVVPQLRGRAVWSILSGITILEMQFAPHVSNTRDVFSKL